MNKFNDEEKQPWWVIAAKIVVYALGLLLAGYGTASAAQVMF